MAGAHKEGSVQERNFLLKKDGPRIRNVSLHHQGFGTALRCLACWRMIGMDQTERMQQFMTHSSDPSTAPRNLRAVCPITGWHNLFSAQATEIVC